MFVAIFLATPISRIRIETVLIEVVRPGMLSVFHIGCLVNKEEVRKRNARPRFMVVFEVTYSISRPDLEWINKLAYFETVPYKVYFLQTVYGMSGSLS